MQANVCPADRPRCTRAGPPLRRRRAGADGGIPRGRAGARARSEAPLRAASDLRRAAGPRSTGWRRSASSAQAACSPTRAGTAGSLWVAVTIATNGLAAVRSGRPYRCWLGTSLDDEWAARARGLDPARRLAQRLNAPLLRPIERRVIRGAERVYATSPASRRAVARRGGLDEASIGILPIPVDVERFTPEPDDDWLRAPGRAGARLRRPRRRPAQEPAAAARRAAAIRARVPAPACG